MSRPVSKVATVVVGGPLASFAEQYIEELSRLGYTPLTIVAELRQLRHLSDWMEVRQLTVGELDDEHLASFFAGWAPPDGKNSSFRCLLVLRLLLIRAGALEAPLPAPLSEDELLLERFRVHLVGERGLANATIEAYLARARCFLADRGGVGGLRGTCSSDVTRAVERETRRVSVSSTQYFVAGLRAFLRFCHLEGLVTADLSAAALAVTGRRGSSLPKGISGKETAALLASCDRRRSLGRRDHAVLLVLLRLGLRAGEVGHLSLDDIDRHRGEIVVTGKNDRSEGLPLPTDVGDAIVAYLRRGRPKTERREVFMRAVAPLAPLGRGGISSIVRRACRRAGSAPVGAHRLRHTVACGMVTAGVELGDIGQVLRQSSLSATTIYARLDLESLRELALPWPEGDRR